MKILITEKRIHGKITRWIKNKKPVNTILKTKNIATEKVKNGISDIKLSFWLSVRSGEQRILKRIERTKNSTERRILKSFLFTIGNTSLKEKMKLRKHLVMNVGGVAFKIFGRYIFITERQRLRLLG